MAAHLNWRDALLAIAIVFVWGTNFVVIRVALDALPPLFLATLRFVLVSVPACFFLRVRGLSATARAQEICVMGQSGILWLVHRDAASSARCSSP